MGVGEREERNGYHIMFLDRSGFEAQGDQTLRGLILGPVFGDPFLRRHNLGVDVFSFWRGFGHLFIKRCRKRSKV